MSIYRSASYYDYDDYLVEQNRLDASLERYECIADDQLERDKLANKAIINAQPAVNKVDRDLLQKHIDMITGKKGNNHEIDDRTH